MGCEILCKCSRRSLKTGNKGSLLAAHCTVQQKFKKKRDKNSDKMREFYVVDTEHF